MGEFMLKAAKVVGLNSDTDASLAYIFDTQAQVSLFAIVSASLDDAFSRTRQALAEAETIFESSSSPVGQRIQEVFTGLGETLKDASDLQILLAGSVEDESEVSFYLTYQGEQVHAFLAREGKMSDLCALGQGGELISGVLKGGDRIVMVTQSLVELLGESFAKLTDLPVENLEDEVCSYLPEAQVYPVAVIMINNETPEEIAEIKAEQSEIRTAQRRQLPEVSLPSRKSLAILGAMLILVLVIGGIFSYRGAKEKETMGSFNQNLQKAQSQYEQAKSAKDQDFELASKSLAEAKSAVSQALAIKPNSSEALNLKKQLEDSANEIMKVFQVGDLPLWLDLDLIKKGFTPSNLSLSHGKILVLDTKGKTLALVNLTSKSQEILAGEEKLGEADLASLNGDIGFVLSDKGVVKVDSQSNQVSVVAKFDKEWGNIRGIYGFAGNVYLLDEGKNQIWKYMPIEAGYSDKREYFQQSVNLSGAKIMHIDASIWLLKSSGEILKFTQGAPDYFVLSGLDKALNEPKAFFISDQTDNLYLLDSGNNRLLVVDKKGVYRSQYQSEKFANFSDLVVDEEGKKVYLLEGSKIYLMELK